MAETMEQEKEQVSGIPEEVQDTKSVNSQSTSEAEIKEAQSNDGEAADTASEASIKPEKVDVEKAGHIDSPEDIVRKEGDPNEIPLDLSKIEMDEEGLPVITRIDIDRIKKSNMAITDFEAEIELARDAYRAAKLEFATQDEHDAELTAKIEEAKKRLESASESDKLKLQKEIDELLELKNTLPKYNPEIAHELEQQMINSVKAIAVYQNVSRNTLQKMVNDGTLGALISSTANSVFASAYTDAVLKSKGEDGLYESKTIKELKEKQAKYEEEYTRLSYLFNNLEIVEDKEKQKIIADYIESAKEDKNKKEFITKVLTLLNQLNHPELFNDTVRNKANEEYGKIKLESMVFEDSDKKTEDLDGVKEEEEKREKFIDTIEEYTTAMAGIGFAYQMDNLFRAENRDPRNIKVPTPTIFTIDTFNFGEVWDKDLKYYHDRYDARHEELKKIDEECSEKIDNEIIEHSSKYRETLRKEGLVNGFIEYAFYSDKKRNYFASSKSGLEFENFMISAEAFSDLQRILGVTDETPDDQYHTIKANINIASLMGNNYIRYMEMLLDTKKFDAEWAAKYDPNSELKEWFKENKNFVEDLMKKYIETRDDLSHFLFFDSIVSQKFYKSITKIIDYLTSFKGKAEKFNNGKHVKGKWAFSTKMAYLQNFPSTFSEYLKKADTLSKAIDEKRVEFGDDAEKFNKWYEKEMAEKEHEITRPIIEEILHNAFGMSIIKAFLDYKAHFLTRNENELLSRDITQYIFHEFTLSALAVRSAKDPETLGEYIKKSSSTTTFRSINYEFEKDVIPEDARKAYALNIVNSATNILKGILIEAGDEAKRNAEKAAKDAQRVVEREEKAKNKKPTRVEIQKINAQRRKEAKKARRLVEDKIWNLEKEYLRFISEAPVVSNTKVLQKPEGNYFIEVLPIKDTRAIVKVLLTRKDYSKDNITTLKEFFSKDGIIINRDEPVSIMKAFTAANRIQNDKLNNLGEKWYQNQYVDGSFARNSEGLSLTASGLKTMNRSEICRFVVNTVLSNEYDYIMGKIKDYIISSGVIFDEKEIRIKDNTKFDIKYFNGGKMRDYIKNLNDNGNLNFFINDGWVYLTFEINYDLYKVEKNETKVEEIKEEKVDTNAEPISQGALRQKAFQQNAKKYRHDHRSQRNNYRR